MILLGCLLFFAAAGTVKPFPFNIPIASQSFGYSQAIPLRLPQVQPFQPQLYTFNQPNLNPMISNDQRFHRQQQQQQQQQQHFPNQIPRFNQGPQQNYAQQRLPQQGGKFAQQQFYEPMSPIQAKASPKQLPVKDAATTAQEQQSSADFLSSLQIIDTNGRVRELKDFGLGGTGNRPHEPELERQLKSIFDTINRDLENAAFLPLDMNGANSQLGSIFSQDDYNPSNQQQSVSVENPRVQDNPTKQPPAQQVPADQQQQSLGYSFTQPKQHQFQFLRPQRANTHNSEQPIRSPAQTIRDSKHLSHQKEQQQLPIEQTKEEVNAPSGTKGFNNVPEQQAVDTASKAAPKIHRESAPRHQQGLKSAMRLHDNSNQYQQPRFEQQKKIQVEQSKIAQEPVQEQQQHQQTGFDDEPAPLKTVEHDSNANRSNGQSYAEELNQEQRPQSPSKGRDTFEQSKSDDETHQDQQHRAQQQQNYENNQQTSVQSSGKGAGKYDGWVPVTQPIIEQQKVREPQQAHFEQSDEQQFESQKPISQHVEPQIEQQRSPKFFGLSQSRNEGAPQQANVQPAFFQQAPARDSGKQNIFKKAINKITTSSFGQFFNDQQQEKLDQAPELPDQQIREQLPVQQQEELPPQQNEQRPDISSEKVEQIKNDAPIKQEQYLTTQREEYQQLVSSTTQRPISRPEQGVKGRRVKLAQQIRTPIQRAREQQSKSIKQQQQQQQQQVPEQDLSLQGFLVQQNQETKTPKSQPPQNLQLKQAPRLQAKGKQQQVKIEAIEQLKSAEPATLPVAPVTKQERRPEQQKQEFNQQEEITSQQKELHQENFQEPEVQQQKEQFQISPQQAEPQIFQQQQEIPANTPEIKQQTEAFQQQREQINDEVQVKQEQQNLSQVEEVQPIVTTTTQKPVQRARKTKQQVTKSSTQKARDQGFRQQIKVTQSNEQPEVQQVKDVQSNIDEPVTIVPLTTTTSQTIFDATIKQEELSQQQQVQQEEAPLQQQRQEETQVTQQQQQDFTPQQQDFATQQQQQQDFTPQQQQQQDFTPQQQQQQDFAPQQQQQQTFTPQQQDFTPQQEQQQEFTPQLQQQQQQEIAPQQAPNFSQQVVNSQQQETTRNPEQPRVTQQVQQEEVSTQAIDQPKSEQQQKEQTNDEVQLKQELFTTTQRDEFLNVPTTTQRPPIRRTSKGNKSRKGQQTRVTQARLHQQSIGGFNVQEDQTQYRDDGLNHRFNIDPNTYNPLQFEPERISSLTRATQITNVNSSGESY